MQQKIFNIMKSDLLQEQINRKVSQILCDFRPALRQKRGFWVKTFKNLQHENNNN
jgi:hypothetical protein